ncbi:MAG: histidine kinase [Lachnospiraceae bacterium]|nr:histidine kinase [Lachnospiraceae bacterium]
MTNHPAKLLGAQAAFCVLLTLLLFALTHSRELANTLVAGQGYSPMFIVTEVEKTTEAIPDYAGVRNVYRLTLPEARRNYPGMNLTFFLRHQFVELYDDAGEPLPVQLVERTTPHIGRTHGSYWISLRPSALPESGKLTIALTPSYAMLKPEEPVFVLTERYMSFYMALYQDLPFLLLSATALISGLFLTAFSLFLPAEGKRGALILLGALSVCTGLWKLTGLPVLSFVFNTRSQDFYYAGALAWMLLTPLTLSLMLAESGRASGAKRASLLAGAAFSLQSVLVFAQLAGALELHDALLPLMALSPCLMLLTVFLLKPQRSQLLRLAPFPAAALVDLLVYLKNGSARYMLAFLFFMLANVLFRSIQYFRSSFRRERELKSARIRLLTSQIRPHFLFNALASVYYLLGSDPERAMEVVNDLSDYLRANFTAIAKDTPVPFSEELAHTKSYLAVEEMRFQNRLSVTFELREQDFFLPALTLQPIVENAIRHGIRKDGKALKILVETAARENYILLSVRDNGPGFGKGDAEEDGRKPHFHRDGERSGWADAYGGRGDTSDAHRKLENASDVDKRTGDASDSQGRTGDALDESAPRPHIGLENVAQRLSLMCGGELQVENPEEGGCLVVVRIPGRASYCLL